MPCDHTTFQSETSPLVIALAPLHWLGIWTGYVRTASKKSEQLMMPYETFSGNESFCFLFCFLSKEPGIEVHACTSALGRLRPELVSNWNPVFKNKKTSKQSKTTTKKKKEAEALAPLAKHWPCNCEVWVWWPIPSSYTPMTRNLQSIYTSLTIKLVWISLAVWRVPHTRDKNLGHGLLWIFHRSSLCMTKMESQTH